MLWGYGYNEDPAIPGSWASGPSVNCKQNTKAVQKKGKPDLTRSNGETFRRTVTLETGLEAGAGFWQSKMEVSVLGNKWFLYLETTEIKICVGKETQAGWIRKFWYGRSDGWVGRRVRVMVLGTSHTSLRRSPCFDLCLEGWKIRMSSKQSKQQPLT